MAFVKKCLGIFKNNSCIKKCNYGFNTMEPETPEVVILHEKIDKKIMKDKILALGLPLKVFINKDGTNNFTIYPSLKFFEGISTPDADPEYTKMVDYNDYDQKHVYPVIRNFIELNDKLQIENIKVQVIVNSPIYTIQHSIMVTWLFTEFINRMGLKYSSNCTPPYAPYPIWTYTTYYVADPTHSQGGSYFPYIKSCPCEKYITEESYQQSIMTIDMAKENSKNIYAYFPNSKI